MSWVDPVTAIETSCPRHNHVEAAEEPPMSKTTTRIAAILSFAALLVAGVGLSASLTSDGATSVDPGATMIAGIEGEDIPLPCA